MRSIIWPAEADDGARMGGKARALAALARADLPIPEWFVVEASAVDALEGADEGARAGVEAQLRGALDVLCANGDLVAVRSSAEDEDGADDSFAGQLDSYLFVPPDEVSERVRRVRRSGFGERVLEYRRQRGLGEARAPAVIVQRMVDAAVAGVAFSADPVTGARDEAVVAAVYGLGTQLVSGEGDADTYRVRADGTITRRDVASKTVEHRMDPDSIEGVRPVDVDAGRAGQPALDDAQIRAVAALARRAEEHFGVPQDIEWAIEDGRLFLLQSRPITTLADVPSQAHGSSVLNIWDNSNITESYSGITTPLTYSFARGAYEEVYRQLCRVMRVPPAQIALHRNDFRRMIGSIDGRVYYNLLSWYRLLSIVPGFGSNQAFMEKMMGVRESLPDEIAQKLASVTRRQRLLGRVRLIGLIISVAWNHVFLRRRMKEFYERLERLLGNAPSCENEGADVVVAYYRRIERELLGNWDVPLINDFLAMVYFGVLSKLTVRWCNDVDGTLQNDLLRGQGGMISAEPARLVREMGEVAARHPALAEALRTAPLAQLRRETTVVPEFAKLYRTFLQRFGDRCLEELKLESSSLVDDPSVLLRSVGALAQRIAEGHPPPAANDEDVQRRAAAEARVRAALRWRPLRRVLFAWVLRNARARVVDRENLRFERTRVFGRTRTLFNDLGRTFARLAVLDDARDIYYLEVDEVLGFVEGTTTCTDLRGLSAVRKAAYERFRAMEPPPDRFETRGVVNLAIPGRDGSDSAAVSGEVQSGLGASSGIVRARARVIEDPRNARLEPGEILVAERTDPGWIMLFASASGIVTERGSLLSHSAIVARELGIPAVVSVPGVCGWLRDGDVIEIDGAKGTVTRIERAAEADDAARETVRA